MEYRLKIENFGKIKKADIKVAPFTLFVGDNNSGKSYLLSLIWGIQNLNVSDSLFTILLKGKLKEYIIVNDRILEALKNSSSVEKRSFTISTKELEAIWNYILREGKEKFVSNIFNYNKMEIEHLSLQFEEKEIVVEVNRELDMVEMLYKIDGQHYFAMSMSETRISKANIENAVVRNIIFLLLKLLENMPIYANIYLPAARTGFMLSKDVINQVARRNTFDWKLEGENSIETSWQPFTKPIIHFLDALDNLRFSNITYRKEIEEIIRWLEEDIVKGSIQYQQEGNEEVQYVPMGKQEPIPLRTSSAVVTELTPLILLLKYKENMKMICYEEPEMCLHPQLQLEMGKLLIRLVNNGIKIITTTHSDIILQHINNMCRAFQLCKSSENEKIKDRLGKLGFMEWDRIDQRKIAVYQLTDEGSYSTVEEIRPGKHGFDIPTFSNALMDILEQTTEIDEMMDEE